MMGYEPNLVVPGSEWFCGCRMASECDAQASGTSGIRVSLGERHLFPSVLCS